MKNTLEQVAELKVTISEATKRITELENSLQEPSAKDWLLDFLSQDFTVKLTKDKITYFLGKQWVIQQDLKTKYLWVYYYKIWQVLESKYNLDTNAIKVLIEGTLGEALNCKGFTTPMCLIITAIWAGEALNCNGFTTQQLKNISIPGFGETLK